MTKWLWFQLISFQVMWLTLILGGNTWLPVTLAILAMHFVFTPSRIDDSKVLILALGGFIIDLSMMQLGFFNFSAWPVWLLFLWAAFILNLGHSMRFLRKFKWIYLISFSALGGVYAYWASWKLGAVIFPQGSLVTLTIVGILWGIWLPMCVKMDVLMRQKSHV
ncbi:DUF2878 domain-containing protein [Oceanospirillaceae bacterium]|jgi:hypothetical protein|nr:DUF2878 domain-containing protein [Oceanospirillaceae bacterium]MDB9905777.1 DUF2878 domain-containing protein [Oceanospirillaceae bacterium]MDC1351119.1 DUF2878 domain-containing protein [Oceanospirillaceae bacterium]MDO7574623.1 DUF2878 domain-containing protein [Oceanospirillaceae bacterium]HAW16739.1 DUF2878 domain-containing protein [Oceanospirillaceae bacterium]